MVLVILRKIGNIFGATSSKEEGLKTPAPFVSGLGPTEFGSVSSFKELNDKSCKISFI